MPLFLSAEGRHRPSLDMSDGIPSMGALRAGRPEIQAVPVDCLCCAQATGELHHQKVDAGTSGCIDPFGSTPTRSPIHLAPRRLLLDDLHTTCWVLHAAQSLTSKSWVPISILSMPHTWRFSQLFPLVILGSEPVSDRYRATAPYRCRSVSELWRTSHCSAVWLPYRARTRADEKMLTV